ncbi:MAG: hypothetical protein IJW23_03265 [Lentisphaeria bacterium]|nr:hypothetical protein [Lentisphaeria bacterium]
MKKIIISALVFSAAAILTANTLYIRDFPFMRKAKLKGTPGKIAAIPLDLKLYKNTNDRYTNIRIIDSNGRNVPFSVKNVYPLQNKHLYAVYPSAMTDFRVDQTTKSAVAEFAINPEGYISRLTFPAEKEMNGQKISLVFFDGKGKMISGQKDFLLRIPDGNSDIITLDIPPVKARKLKISLTVPDYRNTKSAKQFLEDISIEQKVSLKTPGLPQIMEIALPEISRINKGTLTEITVDANRVPCTELILKTDNKIFNRYIEVFSRTQENEKCIASQNFSQKDKGIPLQEVRGDYYIVRIFNANREPLQNIRLLWEVRKKVLMFIPPEKGDVRIYYGGNAKTLPYDIEYAERYGLPPQVYELEEETWSPDYEPQIPTINLYKYFLWVIIFIAGMLLFLTIIRMINKNRDWDDENKQHKD